MLTETANRRSGRVERLVTIALLYVACIAILGPTLRFSQWYASKDFQAAAEAMAWLEGRLDVPDRALDMAEHEGRCYNVFPPLWTIISFAVYGLNRLLFGEPLIFWTPLYVLIVAGPIPLLAYLAFRGSGAGPRWAAVLAFHAIAGTCLWPEATLCREGWIYAIQHVLSQAGLAMMLWDLLGPKRFWVAGLGVLVAGWSRQTCLAYALPVLWVAWRSPQRTKAMMRAGVPLLVTFSVPMILNYAKFGSPLETGYRYIFNDPMHAFADCVVGPDGSVDVFALRYFPRHFYHMWLAPPLRFEMTHAGPVIQMQGAGTAVWLGTPLLLLVFVDARKWWADSARRALLLSSLLVMFTILSHHGPLMGQAEFNRYSLDFTWIWLGLITPWTDGPKRRWFTLICLGWSVFFFYMVTTG